MNKPCIVLWLMIVLVAVPGTVVSGGERALLREMPGLGPQGDVFSSQSTAFTLPGTAKLARTFDMLTSAELDQLSKATLAYYMCVADRLSGVSGADKSTPERIIATYPPYILILRQQCRVNLLNLEKLLYGFTLNPGFITNHVNTLREDVVHFSLQQVMKKAAEEKATIKNEADWKKETGNQEVKPGEKPRASGLGIFTAPRVPNVPEKK